MHLAIEVNWVLLDLLEQQDLMGVRVHLVLEENLESVVQKADLET